MLSFSIAQARIHQLCALIHKYNYSYYCLESSDDQENSCTDETYDELVLELKTLEKQCPELRSEDSPTLQIKGEPHSSFPSRKHLLPMLSLGNVYSLDELKSWDTGVKKLLGGQSAEYVCELKIDGVAVSAIYRNGILSAGVTRGDGSEGEEITPNIKTITCLPLTLKDERDLEVRGEVYLPRKSFDALNQQRVFSKIQETPPPVR
jgi:DNA ligase (NAD+)